jgi:hypothetical protein
LLRIFTFFLEVKHSWSLYEHVIFLSMKDLNFKERKLNALTIQVQAKTYLSTGVLESELDQKIKNLKQQDSKISIMNAIEILLDFAEREFVELEKNRDSERPLDQR